MPLAMSVVWDVAKASKSKKFAELLLKFDSVLGLNLEVKEEKNLDISDEVLKLIEERKVARQERDWNRSDILRDEIEKLGYIIKDTKDGLEIKRI
ncbi:Cysteine--tRNA ligase [compost metagenome]